MSVNRIHILNWRQHNDDESYCKMEVFAADEEGTCQDLVEEQIDPDYDWNQDECPGYQEDWDHVYYVNDDFTIENGQEFTSEVSGRKFKVSITEVKA